MKATAVICEYNPFHKGHEYQINAVKAGGSRVVCIMSGGFVQRGGPALYDKYVRAEAAVRAGADLVLELPYPYCSSAAEHFARGGVAIADSLGVIDELCFGSECGDISLLEAAASNIASSVFSAEMKKARADKANKDKPFAVLNEEVYSRLFGDGFPLLPNDILGVEYIKALKGLKSGIKPVTYKREKGWSATKARAGITERDDYSFIPEAALPLFEKSRRYYLHNIEGAILAFYRMADPGMLKKYEGMTNGIADRIVKLARECTDLDGLTEGLSGKSYTNAKIRRCIIHGMTAVTPEMLKCRPAYTQVLACGKGGRELMRLISKKSDIPVLTKPSHYKKLEGLAKEQAELSLNADRLLTLMCQESLPADAFLKKTPFISEE